MTLSLVRKLTSFTLARRCQKLEKITDRKSTGGEDDLG